MLHCDNAIFKIAAVRHLEFTKIAVLVTFPKLACDPSSLFQISRWSANMTPRYSQKTIFNMALIHHLGFVMTSSYCIRKGLFTFPTLLIFHGVRFRNFLNGLVGEPKETKKERKEERHPKQWQTGFSPRPPTSSDHNETLHGGWPAVCSYICQVWSKSVQSSLLFSVAHCRPDFTRG